MSNFAVKELPVFSAPELAPLEVAVCATSAARTCTDLQLQHTHRQRGFVTMGFHSCKG